MTQDKISKKSISGASSCGGCGWENRKQDQRLGRRRRAHRAHLAPPSIDKGVGTSTPFCHEKQQETSKKQQEQGKKKRDQLELALAREQKTMQRRFKSRMRGKLNEATRGTKTNVVEEITQDAKGTG